ncbi:uncharacterized protein LOC100381575 [Zea mays]|uniref:Uncharacterized protein n=1 Tax=Zea mays TaxID=4577 RepID=C0HH63_MAIZE|nr:uncharacterized protein LOC100381575 [Zea mays]ACN26366.1 unknown [Zea mays]|eukprot:NP_001167871.1 uncharacterized protein LOC100381575 [Zea mays]
MRASDVGSRGHTGAQAGHPHSLAGAQASHSLVGVPAPAAPASREHPAASRAGGPASVQASKGAGRRPLARPSPEETAPACAGVLDGQAVSWWRRR